MTTVVARRMAGTSLPIWLVLLLVFAVSWVAVAIHGGEFVTITNLQNMAQRSVALGLVAIGQTLVVLAGSLDLSVAYMVSVSAVTTSVVMGGAPANILIGCSRRWASVRRSASPTAW